MAHPEYGVSANVRAEAARRGVSQSELADRVGMSWSTWQRRMRRPDLWTVAEVRAVADALDVDPDLLWRNH